MIERYPSLSLNWLHKEQKDIPTPQLIIQEWPTWEVGGCYWPVGCDGNEEYQNIRNHNGTIFVNVSNSESIEETLAHEWRHHYQYWQLGMAFKHITSWDSLRQHYDYKISIKKYFTQWHEWDALTFAHHKAGNDTTESWLEIINDTRRY